MTLMNSSVGDEVQITSQGKMIKSFAAVQARQKETNINILKSAALSKLLSKFVVVASKAQAMTGTPTQPPWAYLSWNRSTLCSVES